MQQTLNIIVVLNILMMGMSSCSSEKIDNIFMDGLPQLEFTIDYACFLNHDNIILIGRHKEYNDSISLNMTILWKYIYHRIKGANGCSNQNSLLRT